MEPRPQDETSRLAGSHGRIAGRFHPPSSPPYFADFVKRRRPDALIGLMEGRFCPSAMFSVRSQKYLANAKRYFREHLGQGDAGLAETQGHWFGQGAARLGLTGDVTAVAYERLCDNLHPQTGEQLTPLTLPGRRIFYDFVVSAPKSVSILGLTMGDHRLLKLHNEAVEAALQRMEEFAQTRVRVGQRDEDRDTCEVVAALFRHESSRTLDPQLHTHVVVFNSTWDPVEQRWKALQAGAIYEAIHYLTEVYRSELAAGLKELGYRLSETRHGFEIEGVAPELLRKFSQRRQQIEAAESRLVARRGRPLSTRGRARVAAATRTAKAEGISSQQVVASQLARMSSTEISVLRSVVRNARGTRIDPVRITASQALDHARDHLFERASVVTRHELFREALAFARGDVREPALHAPMAQRPEFIRVGKRLTTCGTLRAERELIACVNGQANRHAPFAPPPAGNLELTEEQQQALRQLLQSPDGVICLTGAAGTGKTHVLARFVQILRESKRQVLACAPTAGAVEVLRQQGFDGAQTIQRLLVDEALQRGLAGQVILVDEANLLSVGQFQALFRIARTQRCRTVLSGDTRQHHSVESGDALRVLENHSQLKTISIERIQRQKPADYRAAVAEIAAGKIAEGYARLDQMGAIAESTGDRHERLALEYSKSIQGGHSALIVSPTWQEIAVVTGAVRARLKTDGRLSGRELTMETHQSLNWTQAQKRDTRNYEPGMILLFHKRTACFAPGEWARVERVEKERIHLQNSDGTHEVVTRKQAGCFSVAEARQLPVAPGEKLLIQANCRERRLINGQIATVQDIDRRGTIRLTDGRRIDPSFRSFTHGYCLTAHAAEGKTVDHIYLDASQSRAAHREQFYVSVSRGRHRVRIFTDDRARLLESVSNSSARLSAVELTAGRQRPARRITPLPEPHAAPKISLH